MKSKHAVFTAAERAAAKQLAELSLVNPFHPRRVQLEAEVLGHAATGGDESWNLVFDAAQKRTQDSARLLARLEPLLARRPGAFANASREDVSLYELLVRFHLFLKFQPALHRAAVEAADDPAGKPRRVECWRAFREEAGRLLGVSGGPQLQGVGAEHLFATLFQLRRAFIYIYRHIVGRSPLAARLRAAVWESIFTHDLEGYIRSRHRLMGDLTTLITGPSGSGKEPVARAIALARYVPFDGATQGFAENFAGTFHPLNLSALTPTLVESEMFGHKRGSFTGALADRVGWLERCSPQGTVFLDEIGELDLAVQVKLLRVLQTREFQRVGDTVTRRFRGKIVAATNRDLGAAIAAHRFRADLYYRLCADILHTPSLRDQLAAAPGDLAVWVEYIARQMGEAEPAAFVAGALAWMEKSLGPGYEWPGNFRELEQCVRNIWIRKSYRPLAATPQAPGDDAWLDAARAGTLTADELLQAYCARVLTLTGNHRAAARKLGLDWRTVRQYAQRAEA